MKMKGYPRLEPGFREVRKSPDADSTRSKRARITELERLIEELDEFRSATSRKRGFDEKKVATYRELVREKTELAWALKNAFEKLQLKEGYTEALAKELLSRRWAVEREVPEEVIERWKKEFYAEHHPYSPDDFSEAFEETARDTVMEGIKRLHDFFEEMYNREGVLPSRILYPDSGARPLRYAIQPLVESVYSKYGVAKPSELFIKTFSTHETNRDTSSDYGDEDPDQQRLASVKKELAKIKVTRAELLRELRGLRKTSETWQKLSFNAQTLQDNYDRLSVEAEELKERIYFVETRGHEQIFTERMREAFSVPGNILVVDDVLAGGRTLRLIEREAEAIGRKNDLRFFFFITAQFNLEKSIGQDEERLRNFAFGTALASDDVPDVYKKKGRFVNTNDADREKKEWSELYLHGFPYRGDKASLGVKKDQASPSKYVDLSEDRDSEAIRSVRRKYREWGREALKDIEI